MTMFRRTLVFSTFSSYILDTSLWQLEFAFSREHGLMKVGKGKRSGGNSPKTAR
jgi:hypothetical protein